MENLSLCRICLATDVRLFSIASHLRDIYERVTAMTFKREDKRPLVACYICQARLRYCYRLRTSCLRSEEQLTEMLSSGVFKPQDVLSTNTFGVVPALHLSLGHAPQDNTECHVKEEASEVIWVDLGQLYTEDTVAETQEKQCALIDDNNQCSHLDDPLDIIKEEPDDFETDAEYINLEEGDIKIEEIGWEPDIAGPSSQSANNICPKIGVGGPVFKKNKIGALKDTEDASTNKTKTEIIKNERTETITIKEPKFVTKKIEVEKLVTRSKILETCNKVDLNLYKCDDNVSTSVVYDVCGQKYTNNTSLKQNVSSNSSRKNKTFTCDTCNKSFSYKRVLKDHVLLHASDKPYQCNICKKCFIQKGHLKTHILTHTGEKPYKCNVCNKCFTYKNVLKTHLRTHTGEKPYQCNICKKRFVGKGDLNRHILTHTGEKQYQCNVCNKYFGSKQVLKDHIRTHTGEKPYKCNVCMKCFIQRGILKRHLLTHTGEKSHQCNICNKCFIHKNVLRTHIRTHTGEKPYQCIICNKSFSDASSYSRHNRIHKR